jgi:DNA polymerase-3 subunit gamma/tau
MTQALARKWRPRTFAELVGQEHVVQALSNALGVQRLHHAYLFTGTRGVGKTTLARILAKSFNCERGVSATPCGTCSACSGIDAGRFVDLLEVDAASNTQVDKMRELLENALYAPTAGRYKVYVIDEVHQLSGHSFNAMLKTLEEPPEHVKFVLATTDPQKVPVTVLSRCLQFNLRQIPAAQIKGRLAAILEQEGVDYEPAALVALAQAARGSLRDALSLLDQAIAHGGGKVTESSVAAMLGLVGREHLHRILQALAAGDGPALIAAADAMAAHGLAFEQALQELASLLHRVALAQLVPGAATADTADAAEVARLAQCIGPEEVQLYYQIANQGRAEIVLAPDDYAGFTMTLLRMLAFAPEVEGAAGGGSAKGGANRKALGSAPVSASDAAAGSTSSEPSRPPAANGGRREGESRAEAVQSSASRDGIADWPRALGEMKLSGMAGQLAQHCELVGESDGVVELCLAEAQKHLLEKGPQERLRLAVQGYLRRDVRLRISVGKPQGPTPAELDEQQRSNQLAAAAQSLDADPFVRELVEGFGARVVPDSIKPQR